MISNDDTNHEFATCPPRVATGHRRCPKNMKRSVHDNHLTAFEVDGVGRRIVLHIEYENSEAPFEKIEVVFEGLVDHYFRNAILPSIIFGIEEVDSEAIILRDKATIDEGHRTGGWPSFWEASADAMAAKIKQAGGKMFELSSSYGMDGWMDCCCVLRIQASEPKRCAQFNPLNPDSFLS